MSSYTQQNRRIAITTGLDYDVLLLRGFTGQEGLSTLFDFELDLLSEKPDVDHKDVIGKPATISIKLADGSMRYINGLVSRFSQGSRSGVFTSFKARLVPSAWLLTRKSDSAVCSCSHYLPTSGPQQCVAGVFCKITCLQPARQTEPDRIGTGVVQT